MRYNTELLKERKKTRKGIIKSRKIIEKQKREREKREKDKLNNLRNGRERKHGDKWR